MQAALAASARAEASLGALFRALQNLGSGASGAREANESLTVELEALRDLLGTADEQKLTFEDKVEQLEAVLDRTRKEHARERTFLIEQQDSFLVQLLDEQEAELKRRDGEVERMRERMLVLEHHAGFPGAAGGGLLLIEPGSQGALPAFDLERAELERTAQKLAEDRERARETVARFQAQRDDAQSAVLRITKERDEALSLIHRLKSELGGPRIPLSTRPSASDARRDSSSGAAATLPADAREQDARLSRPTAPAPASSPPEDAPGPLSEGAAPEVSHISSVLSPPRSRPNAAPLPTRLSPPPTRISPLSSAGRPSPPPLELQSALTNPPQSSSRRPPLGQKPDASTRPLVGYSLNEDSVEPEHLEGAGISLPPSGHKR